MPTEEKEQLLLAGELRAIDANRFQYVGARKTMVFHDFRELARLAQRLNVAPTKLKRFLAGHFVWEFDEQRIRELMETPEGLQLRLPQMVAELAAA